MKYRQIEWQLMQVNSLLTSFTVPQSFNGYANKRTVSNLTFLLFAGDFNILKKHLFPVVQTLK